MPDILGQLIVGITIAAASSWITVRLSLRQFRSERWWEKKVQAYERVIDAFHHSKNFSSEHLDAEYEGLAINEHRDIELRKNAKEARVEILRATDVGGFILSSNAMSILAKYEAESKVASAETTWVQYLHADWEIAHRYLKELINEAHADLKK